MGEYIVSPFAEKVSECLSDLAHVETLYTVNTLVKALESISNISNFDNLLQVAFVADVALEDIKRDLNGMR